MFLDAAPINGLIGSVVHLNHRNIADKVLADELSSAIPALPIIYTLSVSFQRCSSDKNSGSGEVSFLIIVTRRSTSGMVYLRKFHSHC